MTNIASQLKIVFSILLLLMGLSSCFLFKGNRAGISSTTGLKYGTDQASLGYQPYDDQTLLNPPGMVFVQGGRTILGSFEQDLYGARDNIERTVTVSSFWMDETEMTNADWKEYVFYQYNPIDLMTPRNVVIENPNDNSQDLANPPQEFRPDYAGPTHSKSNPKLLEDIVPDNSVWSSDFSFNDVYAENYYANPGFNDYPVVGVSWRQVVDYTKWRTDVNNLNLIFLTDYDNLPDNFKEEFILKNEVTGAYEFGIGGQPIGNNDDENQVITVQDFDDFQQEVVEFINEPANKEKFIERGIYLPDFRLPNEAEWEYAAKATLGTVYLDENEEHGRIYPWDGRGVRNPYGKKRGQLLANFKRGRGDYAGIAGGVNNDASVIPEPVGTREPNDFNLFNMAGNVSEWVFDTYRPLSFRDVEDLNPVRKDGTGDLEADYGWESSQQKDSTAYNPQSEYRSQVNDRSKVYKGGSWKDVAYWMSPGTRRFLDMDRSTNSIGFRCAMISIGMQQLDKKKGLFGKMFGGR